MRQWNTFLGQRIRSEFSVGFNFVSCGGCKEGYNVISKGKPCENYKQRSVLHVINPYLCL